MDAIASAVWVDGNVLTVPVSDEVDDVISAWAEDHGEDLNRRLAPFGLGRYNIAKPVFERVVMPDELT